KLCGLLIRTAILGRFGTASFRRFGPLSRQCGFVANRFKDQPQRRSWRGHGPQSLVLRLVRQQLLHLQLGQRVAPRPDEVVAIEIEKIVGEIVVLLAEGRLLAGFAQDPAVAPHSLRQVTKLANEFVLESVVGEERGNADRIERLASVGLEYTGGIEAG